MAMGGVGDLFSIISEFSTISIIPVLSLGFSSPAPLALTLPFATSTYSSRTLEAIA